MSRYTFTAFRSRKLTAKKTQEESCSYAESYDEHGLYKTTQAIVEWDRYQGKAQFWSGGEYAETHNGDDWQGSAQVTLEYDRECLPYLKRTLNALPWEYTLIHTFGDKGAGVLVQIPLSVRVTVADTYTRIANFLLADIDLIGARNGTDTITYLWQWDIRDAQVMKREDEGVLLEPMSYHLKNKGRQVYAVDYVGLGRVREPLPQSKPLSGDDLFSWGGE